MLYSVVRHIWTDVSEVILWNVCQHLYQTIKCITPEVTHIYTNRPNIILLNYLLNVNPYFLEETVLDAVGYELLILKMRVTFFLNFIYVTCQFVVCVFVNKLR